jgi:hypothetical protein
MKRTISGLSANRSPEVIADGVYLVRVERMHYCWQRQKPFYALVLLVLEPSSFASTRISARLYATAKTLWKLSWFLRDFGYDPQRLQDDQIDDGAVIGLRGVVKISHFTSSGRTYLNLDAFAPAEQWQEQAADSLLPNPPEAA